MTGATPPFGPLARIVEWGGVPPGITPGVTPHYGVAPVRMYPCGKATRPGRGPDGPPPRGARGVTNSSAPFSSSAASGPRPPGRGPAVCPVAVLVRVHTPNFYRAGVAWDDLTPGWAVFLAGQFLISTSRSWVARMGIRVGRRSRLPACHFRPRPGARVGGDDPQAEARVDAHPAAVTGRGHDDHAGTRVTPDGHRRVQQP